MSMTPKEGEILSEIIDFLAKRDDELAAKLRDVVEALVEADVQLSGRISLLELDNGTWPVAERQAALSDAVDQLDLPALAEAAQRATPLPPKPSFWQRWF